MIIGVSGVAAAGKDTVGNYLVNVYKFQRYAFADTLKEACRHIFGFTDEQLYGEHKEIIDPYWGFTPRFAMQKVGTECMRNTFDQDIWIKALENKVQKNAEKDIVVTDVRFPNELEAIRRWGGQLVRIDRPNAGASGGHASHSSETSLKDFKDWDYIINNDVQVHAVLYGKVEEMLSTLQILKTF